MMFRRKSDPCSGEGDAFLLIAEITDVITEITDAIVGLFTNKNDDDDNDDD